MELINIFLCILGLILVDENMKLENKIKELEDKNNEME